MKTLISLLTVLGVLALGAGTASAASPAYCDGYARDYANQYANQGADVVSGAVTGAFTGALFGGIFGGKKGVGTGMALGAGLGALGGAANSSPRWQQLYDDAYYQCMGSGPAPQPVYNPGPGYPAGSPEWQQACAAKYKSFQWTGPYAGYFVGYDGQYHACQLP
jgi:hypothetical protein